MRIRAAPWHIPCRLSRTFPLQRGFMGERNDRMDDGEDAYERDLERDNQRGREGSSMAGLPDAMAGGPAGESPTTLPHVDGMGEGRGQHARKGQAESPVEDTHYEPPKKREGRR